MGKGSNSSESTTAPNWQAMQQYSNLLNRATNVASTPYQAYGGEEVAPINQQQQLGIGNINANAGFANPYVQGGANMISASGQPISAADIQRYMSPYTNDVVNATQADFDHSNAVAQSQVTGNAAAQNALGGNRVGVAQSLTAQGNARAQAPIIAGLRNTGFQTALGAAQNQQRTGLQAGSQYGQMGIAGQQAGLAGAGAQIGAGTLEQQTQQAQDTQARMDYFQKQGYDFQTAQWLAGISTGVGSQMGGTSRTEGPEPNPWTQILGAGVAAASFLPRRERGGRISGFAPPRRNRAQGGYNGPWAGAEGWVPMMAITHGKGPPAPPQVPHQGGNSQSNQQMGRGIAAAGTGLSNWYQGQQDIAQDRAQDLAEDGEVWARGGRVGYARGGFATRGAVDDDPTFDERFNAAWPQRDVPTVGGVGASEPAFEGPVPMPRSRPDDLDVINPDEPHRLSGPAAMEGWRGGVDQAHGGEPPPSPEAGPPPPEAGFWPPTPEDAPDRAMALANEPPPSPGNRAINRADRGALPPNAQPTAGVGFPPPPQDTAPQLQREKSFLESIGVEMTPSLRQGLLQAGLAMMATHRGGAGSFLGGVGEGAQAGVGAYNTAENLAQRQAVEQQKLARDDYWKERAEQRAARPYSEMTAAEKARIDKEYKPKHEVIREEMDPDTGIVHKIYGWVDPNTRKAVEDTAPSAATGNPAAPKKIDATLTGDAYLEQLSPGRATLAKKIGDYEVNPASLSIRGGRREQAIADASRYNRGYDVRQFSASNRVIGNYKAGVESRVIRSLNVATDHLDTLEAAAVAMGNGDTNALNAIRNKWREATGSELTTNFDSIKQAVSSEIAKVVVGGQTALGDRDEMAHRAANSRSPQQLLGIFNQFRKLMAGQMNGLRQGYEVGTGGLKDFDKFLLPATRKHLQNLDSGEGGGGKPTLQEFLAKAKPANPGTSEKDLTDYYNKKYQ